MAAVTDIKTYRVWLGSEASIWAHRGYVVAGQTVEGIRSERAARRIVRESIGRYVSMRADDGIYCYTSRADMRADDTGARAAAVISTSEVRT